MLNSGFLEKGLGIVSPSHFMHDFSRKMFPMWYSILTDQFHCLIAFISWDIGQYMYWNCFLTRLWRHKFWNSPYLSIQAVFRYDQKFKTKIELSWEREELLRWNKKHFSSFLKDFQLPKIVSDLRVHL